MAKADREEPAREPDALAGLLAAVRDGDAAARERLDGRLQAVARRRLGRELRGESTSPRDLLHGVASASGGDELGAGDHAQLLGLAASALRRAMAAGLRRHRDDAPDARYLLALAEAIAALRGEDATLATLAELRLFGGLDVVETAEVMGTSVATAARRWRFAAAWLDRRAAPGSAA